MFGNSEDDDAAHVGTISGGTLGADRDVHRVVDDEAGVVVYVVAGGQSVSLDTVPLSETDLDGDGWGRHR